MTKTTKIKNKLHSDILQITPEIWGPPCWIFLHSLALTFDNKYKDDYYYLIKSLVYILPCHKCIVHLKYFIMNEKLIQSKMSKKYLTEWFIKLHNNINNKLNKNILTNKQIYKIISNENYINNKKIITLFIIINYFYLTQKLSLFHFNKIKAFYKLLGNIYPNKQIKQKIKNIVNSQKYKDISNENELNIFFKQMFITLC